MRFYSRFTLLTTCVFTIITLCACGVLRHQNSTPRWLTQAQILDNWVRDSKTELMTPPPGESGDYNFWLIPKGYQPVGHEIWRIMNFIGGPNNLIRYNMLEQDVNLDCISDVIPAFPAAFPITSYGLEMEIQILNTSPLRAENIFTVADSVINEYQGDEIAALGWRELGDNKFRVKIPENTAGVPKLWSICLYYQDRATYDRITREKILGVYPNDWYKNKRWSIGPIYLLQVTDSLNPSVLYPPALNRYTDLLPNSIKWLSDPEGGLS